MKLGFDGQKAVAPAFLRRCSRGESIFETDSIGGGAALGLERAGRVKVH